MARTVEQIYASLGQGIVDSITKEWEEATIFVELLEDAANFKGEYKKGSETYFFEVEDEVYEDFEDFEDLEKIMTKNDCNQWNKAKFTINISGQFNIDFEWDGSLEE